MLIVEDLKGNIFAYANVSRIETVVRVCLDIHCEK